MASNRTYVLPTTTEDVHAPSITSTTLTLKTPSETRVASRRNKNVFAGRSLNKADIESRPTCRHNKNVTPMRSKSYASFFPKDTGKEVLRQQEQTEDATSQEPHSLNERLTVLEIDCASSKDQPVKKFEIDRPVTKDNNTKQLLNDTECDYYLEDTDRYAVTKDSDISQHPVQVTGAPSTAKSDKMDENRLCEHQPLLPMNQSGVMDSGVDAISISISNNQTSHVQAQISSITQLQASEFTVDKAPSQDEVETDWAKPPDIPSTENETTVNLPLSDPRYVKSETVPRNQDLKDFVMLNTDADHRASSACIERLLDIIARRKIVPQLSVDQYSDMDLGRSTMCSLETLYDNYRYILIYVSENLESDRYSQFLTEILITLGLKEGKGKEYRVIPLFAVEKSKIIYLQHGIKGFQYHRYIKTEDDQSRDRFEQLFTDTVIKARREIS